MKTFRTYFVKTLIALCSVMFFASCEEKEDTSKSAACDILEFKIGEMSWDISDKEITHVYPSAILPTPLTPTTIVISPGATVNPIQGQEQNNFFKENGVEYIVTAEDRVTTKIYNVKAIRTPYSECAITEFVAGGKVWNIDDTLITYIFPATQREEALMPMITMSTGAKIKPLVSEAKNFFIESGVKYTVTAEDGKMSKTYTVKARKIYTDCDITSFITNDAVWTIRGTDITYVFPQGTPAVPYTPIITLSQGATVNPPSDAAQNFFAPGGVEYTVTAEDSTKTKVYTVKARTLSSECNIVSFSAGGVTWDINNDDLSITYDFPAGAAGPLTPTIILSDGATVNPLSSSTHNFFTSYGVEYVVTAEDGVHTRTYTAKATALTAKYNTGDWVVASRSGYYPWGDGAGQQTVWGGGHPMLAIDDDAESGWHSNLSSSLPQVLIIDMKEKKRVSLITGTGGDMINVKIYLTDNLPVPGYSSHSVDWAEDYWRIFDYKEWLDGITSIIPGEPDASWGTPIAEGVVANNDFSFTLPQRAEGQYLIVFFPDSKTWSPEWPQTYISVRNIEVYGN